MVEFLLNLSSLRQFEWQPHDLSSIDWVVLLVSSLRSLEINNSTVMMRSTLRIFENQVIHVTTSSLFVLITTNWDSGFVHLCPHYDKMGSWDCSFSSLNHHYDKWDYGFVSSSIGSTRTLSSRYYLFYSVLMTTD